MIPPKPQQGRGILAELPVELNVVTKHAHTVASRTKPLTATGAMQLVEAGALRLDDPIAEVLHAPRAEPP